MNSIKRLQKKILQKIKGKKTRILSKDNRKNSDFCLCYAENNQNFFIGLRKNVNFIKEFMKNIADVTKGPWKKMQWSLEKKHTHKYLFIFVGICFI